MTRKELLEAQGRAISVLRRERKRPRNGRWDGWTYVESGPGKRIFSDQKIRDLLHLSSKQFEQALEAWDKERRPQRWTIPRMQDKILAFAKKHERWPTYRDLRKWRENDLVAPSTMSHHQRNLDTLIDGLWGRKRSHFSKKLILSIPNLTTRRTAIESYGVEKLIKSGDLVQQDDFGTLWALPSDNTQDDRSLYLEVVNSSPEEDGSFAHYYLRVPPDMTSAQEAVAWTYEKVGSFDEDDFKFVAQT